VIPRYARDEMTAIWSEENKFATWLIIEILACEQLSRLGKIPPSSLTTITEKASFSIDRIQEIEKTVKHDVIAFLTAVSEKVGDDARYIHMGLTSSDILDTSLAVQLDRAASLLLDDVDRLLDILRKRAFEHKTTPMMGRSHGIHAEPVTFGIKMALWYEEMVRNRERLERARDRIAYGKLSGAVGTFSFIDPSVERYVCEKLELKPAPVSTQVIQRDRHAEFFTTLAIIAASLEKFAVEIRHLQRTEVREAEEYFSAGQKGSSAMPHKRNPVLSENITGLSRLMRSYAVSAMENVALWHERDISHSSVERVIAPDATILLDFMLHRFADVMENLVVNADRMSANIELTNGVIFSQFVLLKLVESGLSRERAYELVQRNAMKSWQDNISFRQLLREDEDVMAYVKAPDIDAAFDINLFLGNIDYIFTRVFGGNA